MRVTREAGNSLTKTRARTKVECIIMTLCGLDRAIGPLCLSVCLSVCVDDNLSELSFELVLHNWHAGSS